MSEPPDSNDKVELRGFAPRWIVDIVDAHVQSGYQSRMDVLIPVLEEWARKRIHESTIVLRVARGNGIKTELDGKQDGK